MVRDENGKVLSREWTTILHVARKKQTKLVKRQQELEFQLAMVKYKDKLKYKKEDM